MEQFTLQVRLSLSSKYHNRLNYSLHILFSAGAQQLQKACQQFVPDKYGTRCPFGEVRVTPGFKLGVPIFHTVGPKATMGNAEQLLQNCYVNCLNEAERLGLSSIAFPCISTGAYGYKADSAAKVCIKICI